MSEWISVVDEIPEKDQKVIACVYWGDGIVKPLVVEMTWTGSTFRRGPNSCKPGTGEECVTHWMPMPQDPYNG